MSKIMHLIRKITPSTSSKRSSLKSSPARDETATPHQTAVEFAKSSEEDHPPPHDGNNHHHHGRRRRRSLSLTEEKALRAEAREAAEDTERQKHDAERKKAFDEARSSLFDVSHLLIHTAFRIPLKSIMATDRSRTRNQVGALLNRQAKPHENYQLTTS